MFNKVRFEEVHTTHIGDRVLRLRRRRSIIMIIWDYLKKIIGKLHAL